MNHMEVFKMYFPYLRGRQFELIALRELLENNRINSTIIPIIEPVKPTSTLLKTLKTFTEKERLIAVVFDPMISSFFQEVSEMKEESKLVKEIAELLEKNEYIIKTYIMNPDISEKLKSDDNKTEYLIINTDRDCLNDFLEIYEDEWPLYTLIPDNRVFKRFVLENKIVLEDKFKKRPRNIDYIDHEDEFFSDWHLYFKEEGFSGFSDYSIVGEEFNEAGFAPVAVAIHIVYFNKGGREKNTLRIHHFISDSNEGIGDPAGKFGEAVSKLVSWCNENEVEKTLGLQGFYDCYSKGKYPGLGTVKKYSIMHHLELISNFLGGE